MVRMLGSSAIAVFVISCAAPAALLESEAPVALPDAPLGRFMREEVNVPFSFVMLETTTALSGRRVHKAATVLREAARDLSLWSDPPVASDEGREVFYAYAQNLEYHVERLQDAAEHREPARAADTVEQIRQTCNSCHRFFRPASVISPDVAYDWYALELGGFQ
jgi:hypothetical protein